MNVIYGEGTRRTPEEAQLLEQANAIIEDVLDRSADKVKVEWGRAEDMGGRLLYTLRLSEWSGEVSGVFSEDDLRKADRFEFRVSRLWDKQLGVRIDKQLAAARAAGD